MSDMRNPGSEELTKLPGTEGYKRVLPRCNPDRYAIRKFHARGGMGEVWQAEDLDIGRQVALKRLRGERSDQSERFLAEAQITGQLEHPGIVPVHDLGTGEDDQPFYIMSFVSGRTLKDVVADCYAPNPNGKEPREVQRLRLLEIFVKLCQTMAYAHSKGVIHRDLKPDNIMIGPYGEMVVLDWGLAKVKGRPEEPAPADYVHLTYGGSSTATQYGTVIGAPPYMAPEEADGKAAEADERTDVYLLGGTLYEILTGRAPRQGSSKDEMIELARTVPPVPPRQVNPDVPRALDAVCMRALAHRKQDRYAGAAELADEVQRYLAGEPVAALPESFPARAWRWCKRHRQALGRAATAVLMLGMLAFGVTLWRETRERRQRDDAVEQVKKFRELADDLHFEAASMDELKEKQSPFYDPVKGEKTGKEALALAREWGPNLENLPLPAERPEVKTELYAVLLLLAQIQLQQQSSEVKDLLDQAETLAGRSRSLHRLRAKYFELKGEHTQERQEQTLADDPGTSFTALDHFLRGEEHRVKATKPPAEPAEELTWRPDDDQLKAAVKEYQAALVMQPKHYWANFQLGRCLLSLKRNDQAVTALGVCVALRPAAPWGWSARGLAHTIGGNFTDAQRDLDEALKLDPKFQPALLNRGVMFWMQKKSDKALAEFDAVPRAEGAYYRGLVLLEQKKYAEALKEFGRVVKVQPNFSAVHLPRARAFFAQGENKDGLDALDSYLGGNQSLDADSAKAHEKRGRILRRLGSSRDTVPARRKGLLQLALQQLRKAQKLGEKSAELFHELGSVLEKLGQTKEALQNYEEGLKIDKGHLKLLIKRGRLYAENPAKYKEAKEDFKLAARSKDERIRAEAFAGFGYVCAREKSSSEALAAAARALLYVHDKDGHGDYLVVHNVACIFAELALTEPDKKRAHEDVCLEHLRREMALAGLSGMEETAVRQIKGEPSFRALKMSREAEFKEILESGKKSDKG